MILGGGTAGWITACRIAHRWPDARVTLVESPEIGIVGVGEGSTPQLKGLFDQLGISEAEWMPACDATYKLGIGFDGWSDRPGFDRYFHPFPTALDSHTADAFFYNTRARRTGRDVVAHPDRFLLPARLADAACAPQPDETFPFEVSYGYHFDAYKVGAFLARHAVEKRGVTHLQRRVTGVERAADGGIAALLCEDGAPVVGDLFVDSSGFRSVLFEQTLNVPFVRYADRLFNDAAVVLPTPRDPAAPLASQTRATALSAGWVWNIPLTTRSGNGYVYSSRHLSPEQAETELRDHLGVGDSGTARHLTMRVGRVAESWSHNALAVGLAQGFLEPLEATALHLVIATVEAFLDAVDADGFTARARTPFNARIARTLRWRARLYRRALPAQPAPCRPARLLGGRPRGRPVGHAQAHDVGVVHGRRSGVRDRAARPRALLQRDQLALPVRRLWHLPRRCPARPARSGYRPRRHRPHRRFPQPLRAQFPAAPDPPPPVISVRDLS